MGNQSSSRNRVEGIPSEDITLKDGDRQKPDRTITNDNISCAFIPCPLQANATYRSLFNNCDFKSYVLSNMDSTPLISSILQNIDKESLLLDGIAYHQLIDKNHKKQLHKEINKFQSFPLAGIHVHLNDSLSMCEQDLVFRQNVPCSPNVLAFQLRLVALRSLWRHASESLSFGGETSTHWHATKQQSLNSQDFPHLSIVYPLFKSGLVLIQMLAACCGAPPCEHQGLATSLASSEAILESFLQICKSVDENKSLSLFSTWAPAPRRPTKPLKLHAAHVYASSGSHPGLALACHPAPHVHSLLPTAAAPGWSPTTSTAPCSWSVKLESPSTVVAVAVSWTLPSPCSPGQRAPVSAPKVINIRVRHEGPGHPFQSVLQLDLDKEAHLQNGWQHTYYLSVDEDAPLVVEFQLQLLGGPCTANKTGKFRLCNVEVFTNDDDVQWVDILALTNQMQTSLFSLSGCGVPHISHAAQRAFTSSARATGSLGQCLRLVQHMLSPAAASEKNAGGDSENGNLSISWEHVIGQDRHSMQSLQSLIRGVHEQEMSVRRQIDDMVEESGKNTSVLKDVVFDSINHSAGVNLLENALVAESLDGRNNYAMLSCLMDQGVWEWTLSIDKENHSDETCCIGIGRCPLQNSNYDTSADMWLIRCYNGDRYHGGRQPKNASIPSIHFRDECVFTYDAEAQTLALCVNGDDCGVVFNNVDRGGLSPVVCFYGSRKRVRILSCKRMLSQQAISSGGGSKMDSACKRFAGVCPPKRSMPQLVNILDGSVSCPGVLSAPNATSTALLMVLAELARVQVHQSHLSSSLLTSKPLVESVTQSLEYPYCVQVSSDVFSFLLQIIIALKESVRVKATRHHASSLDQSINCLMSLKFLLQILQAQFFFSSKRSINVTELLGAPSSDKYVRIFSPLASVLRSLMLLVPASPQIEAEGRHSEMVLQHHEADLGMLAGEVYASGIALLSPSSSDKVSLALQFVHLTFPGASPSALGCTGAGTGTGAGAGAGAGGHTGTSDSSVFVVLKELIMLLSSADEISGLLLLQGDDSSSVRNLIMQLLRLKAAADAKKYHQNLHLSAFGQFSDKATLWLKDSHFQMSLQKFLENFQVHLMLNLSSKCDARFRNRTIKRSSLRHLLVEFVKALCYHCEHLLDMYHPRSSDKPAVPFSQRDMALRESIVNKNLTPIIHALCFVLKDNRLVADLLPPCVSLFRVVAHTVHSCGACQVAKHLLFEALEPQVQQPPEYLEFGGTRKGWHRVKAYFENSTDNTFAISEDGSLYAACSACKTCAVVEIQGLLFPASGGLPATSEIHGITKISCDFLLEADSPMDEASLFGAALLPLKSRSYSESAQLFVRRAYNGSLYRQGRIVPTSEAHPAPERVHVGNRVRVEIDLEQRTVAYRAGDDAPPLVLFSGLPEGPVAPTCGSYRGNVRIRLLNTEVWGSDRHHGVDSQRSVTHARPSLSDVKNLDQCFRSKKHSPTSHSLDNENQIGWFTNRHPFFSDKNPSVLAFSRSFCKNVSQYHRTEEARTWLTARADSGCAAGVHEWSFHILEAATCKSHDGMPGLMSFGVVMGGHALCATQRLAGEAEAAAPASTERDVILSNQVTISVNGFSPGGLQLRGGSSNDQSIVASPSLHTQSPQGRFRFSEIIEMDDIEARGMRNNDENDEDEDENGSSSQDSLDFISPVQGHTNPFDSLEILSDEDDDDDGASGVCGRSTTGSRTSGERDDGTETILVFGSSSSESADEEVFAPPPVARPSLSRQSTPRGVVLPPHSSMFHFEFDDDDDRLGRSDYSSAAAAGSTAVHPALQSSQSPSALAAGRRLALDPALYAASDNTDSPPPSLPVLSRTSTPSGIPVQNNVTMFNFDSDDDNLDDFNEISSRQSTPAQTSHGPPLPTAPTTRLTAASLDQLYPSAGSLRPGIASIASGNGSRTSSIASHSSSRSTIFEDSPGAMSPLRTMTAASFHSEVATLLEDEGDEGEGEDEAGADYPQRLPSVATAATSTTAVAAAAAAVLVKEVDAHKSSMAWCSDGSLWLNGKKMLNNFGSSFLPLGKLNMVGVRVNRPEQTVSYYVDGQFVGVAFGPAKSGAAVEFSLPLHSDNKRCSSDELIVYPAASVSSTLQSLRVVGSGSMGSVVVPCALFMQQVLTSTLGRMCASLVAAEGEDFMGGAAHSDTRKEKENGDKLAHDEVSTWLSSPLFNGGLDPLFNNDSANFSSAMKCEWSTTWSEASGELLGGGDLKNGSSLERQKSAVSSKKVDRVMFLQEFLSADEEKSPASRADIFMGWLGSTVDAVTGPDPLSLRQALERVGSYSFRACEFMLVACLLKHVKATDEAINVCALLVSGGADQTHPPPPPSSAPMEAIWKKVKSLRMHLRQQRQKLVQKNGRVHDLALLGEDKRENVTGEWNEGASCAVWTRQARDCASVGEKGATRYSVNILTAGFDSSQELLVLRAEMIMHTHTSLEDLTDSPARATHFLETIKPLSSVWVNGRHVLQKNYHFTSFSSVEGVTDEISVAATGFFVFDLADINMSSTSSEFESTVDVIFQFGGHESEFSLCMVDFDFTRLTGTSCRVSSTAEDSLDSFSQMCTALCQRCQLLLSTEAQGLSSYSSWSEQKSEIASSCTTFVLSEFKVSHSLVDSVALVDALRCAINAQNVKSQVRTFGLEALTSILGTSEVQHDPLIIENLFLFLQPAFMAAPSFTQRQGSKKMLIHYYSGLEGSSAALKASVHKAFWQLYALLDALSSSFMLAWEQVSGDGGAVSTVDVVDVESADTCRAERVPSHVLVRAILMLERSWFIHFSDDNDYGHLMSASFFTCMKQLTSFEVYEQYVCKWMEMATALTSFVADKRSSSQDCAEGLSYLIDWKPLSASYVQGGLAGQVLTCRDILLHLALKPTDLLTEAEEDEVGLDKSSTFEQMCRTVDMSSLSLMYEKLLSILRMKEEKRQRDADKDEKERLIRAEMDEERELAELMRAKVPLFDPAFICDGGRLSGCQQVFDIKPTLTKKFSRQVDISRVGSCFGQVEYDLSHPESIHQTGNYFEVTIIDIGIKDMGVGLAVEGSFPLMGEMPGWGTHSYGYHGDDGRKFGDSSTAGSWPPWMEGDVIGCGVVHSARDIFFTRNGVLLGTGFANISDSVLRPVVAFHSPHTIQKAKINFGLTRFLYRGDEIVTHPAALAEQLRRLQATPKDSILNCTSTEQQFSDDESVHEYDNDMNEEKEESDDLIESKEEEEEEDKESQASCRHEQQKSEVELVVEEYLKLKSKLDIASRHLKELTQLRNFSWSLQRFFVTASCVSHVDNEDNDQLPAENKTGIKSFQRDCVDFILRELRLGAKYFHHLHEGQPSLNVASADAKSPENCQSSFFSTCGHLSPLLSLCPVPIVLKSARPDSLSFEALSAEDREEEERVLLHRDCVEDSALAPVHVSTVRHTNTYIEASEAEYFIGKHLFSLICLLPHVELIRHALAGHPSRILNLRALLILSKVGSSRTRRSASNILKDALPHSPPHVSSQAMAPLLGSSFEARNECNCVDSLLLLQVLVSLLRKTVVCVPCTDDNISIPDFEQKKLSTYSLSIESGLLEVHFADQDVTLIRTLCLAPLWRDAVLACVEEWLTSAVRVVKRCSDINPGTPELTPVDMVSLETACVVCSLFTGLNSFYPGAKVRRVTPRSTTSTTSRWEGEGETGWVVSTSSRTQVQVTFSALVPGGAGAARLGRAEEEDGLREGTFYRIESVDACCLETVVDNVLFADDSRSASCWLVLQCLMAACLCCFREEETLPGAGDAKLTPLLYRLTAAATAACSLQLQRNSIIATDGSFQQTMTNDICEGTGSLIRDIALLPLPAEAHPPSLSSLKSTQLFCQARLLEQHQGCVASCGEDDDEITNYGHSKKCHSEPMFSIGTYPEEKHHWDTDLKALSLSCVSPGDAELVESTSPTDPFESVFGNMLCSRESSSGRDLSAYTSTFFDDAVASRFRDYEVGSDGCPTEDVTRGCGVLACSSSSNLYFPGTLAVFPGLGDDAKDRSKDINFNEEKDNIEKDDMKRGEDRDENKEEDEVVDMDCKKARSEPVAGRGGGVHACVSSTPPHHLRAGRVVCQSKEVGSLESLNEVCVDGGSDSCSCVAGRLELLVVSPCCPPSVAALAGSVPDVEHCSRFAITSFLDTELGVTLYHHVAVDNSRLVTDMYHRPLLADVYLDWMRDLDRASIILHARSMAQSFLVSERRSEFFKMTGNDSDNSSEDATEALSNREYDKRMVLLKLLVSTMQSSHGGGLKVEPLRILSKAWERAFGSEGLFAALLQEARVNIYLLSEASIFGGYVDDSRDSHRCLEDVTNDAALIHEGWTKTIVSSEATVITEGSLKFVSNSSDDADSSEAAQRALTYVLEFDRRSSLRADGTMSMDVSLQGKKFSSIKFIKPKHFDSVVALNNLTYSSKDRSDASQTLSRDVEHTLRPIVMSESSVKALSYRFTRRLERKSNDEAAGEAESADDWACRFRLRPFANYLKCIVQRDFELILKIQVDDGSYNKNYFPKESGDGLSGDQTGKSNGSGGIKRMMCVWRPKKVSGYKNLGDVITTSCCPPVGAVLVHSDYCKQIKKFWRVFTNTKHNYSVWRLIPSKHHVCMGDIITIGKDTKPSLTSCAAVPLWAVRECSLGDWVLSSKKSSTLGISANIWSIQSQLGYFLGGVKADNAKKMIKVLSKVAHKFAAASKTSAVPLVSSLGGYSLRADVLQVLAGEWRSEVDVISHKPSLRWTICVLDFMIDSAGRQEHSDKSSIKQLLSSDLVVLLFHHLLSVKAANNLQALPVLIKMLRLHRREQKSFPLPPSLVIHLCKLCTAVHLQVIRKLKLQPSEKLGHALLCVVELVAEIGRNSDCKRVMLEGKQLPPSKEASDAEPPHRGGLLASLEHRAQGLMTSSSAHYFVNCSQDYKGIAASELTVSKATRLRIFCCCLTLRTHFQELVELYGMFQCIHNKGVVNRSNALATPPTLILDNWFAHFRACCCEQSLHPPAENRDLEATKKHFQAHGYTCREEPMSSHEDVEKRADDNVNNKRVFKIIFTKAISFPGASQLRLYVDGRSSLQDCESVTATLRMPGGGSNCLASSSTGLAMTGKTCGVELSKNGPIVLDTLLPPSGSKPTAKQASKFADEIFANENASSTPEFERGGRSPVSHVTVQEATPPRGLGLFQNLVLSMAEGRRWEAVGGSLRDQTSTDAPVRSSNINSNNNSNNNSNSSGVGQQFRQYNQRQLRQYALASLTRASADVENDVADTESAELIRELDSGLLEIDREEEFDQLLESLRDDDEGNQQLQLATRQLLHLSQQQQQQQQLQQQEQQQHHQLNQHLRQHQQQQQQQQQVQPPTTAPDLRATSAGEQFLDKAEPVEKNTAKADEVKTHLVPDAELLIEYSIEISEDVSEGTSVDRDEWGWSIAVSAVSEPRVKSQADIVLSSGTEKEAASTSERDNFLQELWSKRVSKAPVRPSTNTNTNTSSISSVPQLLDAHCSDASVIELYLAVTSDVISGDGITTKKGNFIMMMKFPPFLKLMWLAGSASSLHPSTALNRFESSYLSYLLECVVRKGSLVSTKSISMPSGDGMNLYVDAMVLSRAPDFTDVLRAVSLKFGWMRDSAEAGASSQRRGDRSPFELKRLHDYEFHVMHLCYHNRKGEQMESFCQVPHSRHCLTRNMSAATLAHSVHPPGGMQQCLGARDIVYSIYSISGGVLFPDSSAVAEEVEGLPEGAASCADNLTPEVHFDASWWQSLSSGTNPVTAVSLVMAALDGVCHIEMDTCFQIQNRCVDEDIIHSEEFSIFAAATRGVAQCSADIEQKSCSNSVVNDTSPSPPPEIQVTAEGVFLLDRNIFEVFCHQAIQSNRLTPKHSFDAMMNWNLCARIKEEEKGESFASPDARVVTIDQHIVQMLNSLLLSLPSDQAREACLKAPLTAAMRVMTASATSFDHLSTPPRRDWSLFQDWSLLELQQRCVLLISLNRHLFDTFLPFLDITTKDRDNLGALVRTHKDYLFFFMKKEYLMKSLTATSSNNSKNSNPGYQTSSKGLPAHIRLDNFLASMSKEQQERGIAQSKNCFVQAFQQLHLKDSKIYRFIFSVDRVFHIQFEKENGIDAGGVFREGVTRIIEDLFLVEDFELFAMCPNLDTFLPNHRLFNDPLALQMLEFVGKLMGMSLRVKLTLPFNFPSLVWKLLIDEDVDLGDLRDIDPSATRHIEHLTAFLEPSSNVDAMKSSFNKKYGSDESELNFSFVSGDGIEEELIPRGKSTRVTFDSLRHFCDTLLSRKLHQYDRGIQAMARGLNEVVPLHALLLFSWSELEVLVAGQAVFNISLWKENTECLSSLSPLVEELFWKVMESLSSKEQEGFVRFAWGRSRLPHTADEFVVKMKLGPSGSSDAKLPIAHTCFFQIELPPYRTEEEMRQGLLTVIHYGGSGILLG